MEVECAGKALSAACRTCLRLGPGYTCVFSAEGALAAQIEYCAGVAARPGDALPDSICARCRHELRIAYRFVSRCRRVYRRLLALRTTDVQRLPLADDVRPLCDDYKLQNDVEESGEFFDYVNTADAEWKEPDKDSESALQLGDVESEPALESKKEKLNEIGKTEVKASRAERKGKVSCEVCGTRAAGRAALATHMRTHTGERPFVCHVCGDRFKQKSTLQKHIARRHSPSRPVAPKLHRCDTCNKSFATSSYLKVHVRTHTQERPHACSLCPARFTQLGPLQAHARRHAGLKPHACVACGKSFGERMHLLRHSSVHSDERPFQCALCPVRFKTRYSLKVHTERHEVARRHVCERCGAAFASRFSLAAHARNLHAGASVVERTEPARHSCAAPACSARFSTRRGLSVHRRRHVPAPADTRTTTAAPMLTSHEVNLQVEP